MLISGALLMLFMSVYLGEWIFLLIGAAIFFFFLIAGEEKGDPPYYGS